MVNRARIVRIGVYVVTSTAALLMIVLVSSTFRIEDDPKYSQRSLSDWLHRLEPPASLQQETEAQQAIRAIGTNAIPTLLKRLSYKRGRIGGGWDVLLAKFRSRDVSVQTEIRTEAVLGFAALGHVGYPAVPELKRLLFEEQIPDSALALAATGIQCLPILATALTNQNANLRAYAAAGIRSYGKEATSLTPVLIRLASDTNSWVRISSILTLGDVGDASAISILVEKLADADQLTQKLAAEALGKFGSNATIALPALIVLSTNSSAYVRPYAKLAIERINESIGHDL